MWSYKNKDEWIEWGTYFVIAWVLHFNLPLLIIGACAWGVMLKLLKKYRNSCKHYSDADDYTEDSRRQ